MVMASSRGGASNSSADDDASAKEKECPLCMEPFDLDDLNFFPCKCEYQICRFCWHRIRMDENGLCPACRQPYPEDPVDFRPLSSEELLKLKSDKKLKEQIRKQKISESRKHLATLRVVQKNLVFVVGLPSKIGDPDTLKKQEYFGKFGKIHKVVVNSNPQHSSQGFTVSAYVTYCRVEDALKAIQGVNNAQIDGRTVKACLGTTKYCANFLRNQPCHKQDCMYLHTIGEEAASFTKEEMEHGRHYEYQRKLWEQYMAQKRERNGSGKESWPLSSVGDSKESAADGGCVLSYSQRNAVPQHQRTKLERGRSQSYWQQVPHYKNSRHAQNQNQSRCRNRHSYHHRQQNNAKENSVEPSRSYGRRPAQDSQAIETSSGGSPSSLSSSASSNQSSLNSANGDCLLTMVMEQKYKDSDGDEHYSSSSTKQEGSDSETKQRRSAIDGKVVDWSRPMCQGAGATGDSLFSQDDACCFCPKRSSYDNSQSNGLVSPGSAVASLHLSKGAAGERDDVSDEFLSAEKEKKPDAEEKRYLDPCSTDFAQIDWQEAFGFSGSDDDLGFDPFFESCKALEDLIRQEKEMVLQQRVQADSSNTQRQCHGREQDRATVIGTGGFNPLEWSSYFNARSQTTDRHLVGGGHDGSGSCVHFPRQGVQPSSRVNCASFLNGCPLLPDSVEAPDLSLVKDRSFAYNRFNPQATPFVPRHEQGRFEVKMWQNELKAAVTASVLKFNTKLPSTTTPTLVAHQPSLTSYPGGFNCSMKSDIAPRWPSGLRVIATPPPGFAIPNPNGCS